MANHQHEHAVNWFEIPVTDLPRAQAFYEALLGRPMQRMDMGGELMAMFKADDVGVGGCLVAGPNVPPPAQNGSLVYLNAKPSIDAALARVEAAGGRITTPKVQLPDDMGFFAHVVDTEGNRVGLHALA